MTRESQVPLLLIVDDDQDMTYALCMLLERTGYRTVTAGDVFAANQLAQEQSPDAIVLDLMMPAGGGRRLIEWLRSNPRTQHIPVVIYSSDDDASTKNELMVLGARAYVSKSAPPETLLTQLSAAIGFGPPPPTSARASAAPSARPAPFDGTAGGAAGGPAAQFATPRETTAPGFASPPPNPGAGGTHVPPGGVPYPLGSPAAANAPQPATGRSPAASRDASFRGPAGFPGTPPEPAAARPPPSHASSGEALDSIFGGPPAASQPPAGHDKFGTSGEPPPPSRPPAGEAPPLFPDLAPANPATSAPMPPPSHAHHHPSAPPPGGMRESGAGGGDVGSPTIERFPRRSSGSGTLSFRSHASADDAAPGADANQHGDMPHGTGAQPAPPSYPPPNPPAPPAPQAPARPAGFTTGHEAPPDPNAWSHPAASPPPRQSTGGHAPPGAVPFPIVGPSEPAPMPAPQPPPAAPAYDPFGGAGGYAVGAGAPQPPQAPAPPRAPAPAPPPTIPPADTEPPRLLIVDDSPDERFALATRLERKGFVVLQASDGSQALEIARQHRPDYVISDVHMPGASGTYLCSEISADPQLSSVPVFLMSGLPQELTKAKLERIGAAGFFEKPIEVDLLLALLRNVKKKQAKPKENFGSFTAEALERLDELF